MAKLPEISPTDSGRHLSAEDLAKMNKHEIRAVAHDRGYKIGDHGDLRGKFLAEQGEKK